MSLVKARELREKRANLAKQAEEIIAAPAGENGALSAEQRATFDKIHADIDAMKGDIDRIEQHEARAAEIAASGGADAGRRDTEDRGAKGDERQKQVDEAFSLYLRHGIEGLNAEQRNLMQSRFQRDENRAAQTVSTTGGGYLIPAGFSGQLEESMKAFGGVETVADVFSTDSGNPLPWPTVDDTAQTGALLAINTAVAEQAVTYGVVDFAAYKFSSKLVLVPVELMQDSAFDLDSHLAGVLGTRLARVHNTYQTTGTGSSQPQGIITGASSGVTAASATVVTYDELLDLEHSVDPAYRNVAFGAGWMFNDSTLKALKKMKDGEGRPLWQAGVAGGAPDTIDGFAYSINQDMASIATGTKPIAFGALKKFKVRKVKGFTLLRLVERYADLHQIGFLAFTRMDSRMLDAGTDPVKYITMA